MDLTDLMDLTTDLTDLMDLTDTGEDHLITDIMDITDRRAGPRGSLTENTENLSTTGGSTSPTTPTYRTSQHATQSWQLTWGSWSHRETTLLSMNLIISDEILSSKIGSETSLLTRKSTWLFLVLRARSLLSALTRTVFPGGSTAASSTSWP